MLMEFLQSQIDDDTLVLTINRRLANHLTNCYNKIWPNIHIQQLTIWIENNFSIFNPQLSILSNEQEITLWEKIISQSPQSALLMHLANTARLAQQAWHSLQQYEVTLEAVSRYANTEDTQAFLQWANEFSTLCKENHWLDQTSSISFFTNELQTKTINLPSKILLLGFEQTSPQLQTLFRKLSEHCQLHHYTQQKPAATIKRLAITDTETEIKTMARWAKQYLQENPDTKIGCIIPQLNTLRYQVQYSFTEIFSPTYTLPHHTKTKLPFNIAGGDLLADFPLIYSALQILQIVPESFSLEIISSLLRSPFIAGAELEFNQRALLDIQLRLLGERHTSIRTILATTRNNDGKITPYFCPLLIKSLESFLRTCKQTSTQRKPSQWTELFVTLLQNLGWPGDRTLDSAEYQLLQRWQKLLMDYQQLDNIVGAINYATAYNYLQSLLNQIIFQPETENTPIQILSAIDAIGMEFDALWVMAMAADNWPAAANPNPFLPIKLQRILDMPHASAEQELIFSSQLTDVFCKSANTVIFSYPKRQDDKPLKPSPLIIDFPEIQINCLALIDYLPIENLIYKTSTTELLQDDKGPRVSNNEVIKGGTKIFRDQAACPFRAFAEIRLGATPIPALISGLSPRSRGSLVHEILETLWANISDQRRLHQYSESELTTLIYQTIDTALLNSIKERPLTLKTRFTAIERERLADLIKNWLALEKQRPPFRVVDQELKRQATIAGIQLTMQIDRIDELADGSLVIIDYKTGATKPRINDWLGERLTEPQLPLYYITSDKPIHGIMFAQVHARDAGFGGLVHTELNINGTKTLNRFTIEELPQNWQELTPYWQQHLEKLGNDFYEGKAAVDPKDPPKTCQFCDLQSLCRIAEKQA